MGLYASASLEIGGCAATGIGCSRMLATGTEGPGFGGEKLGYLTVASSWKAPISNGDDLIGIAMQSKTVSNWGQDSESTQTFLWDGRQAS